jgi:hypothetical protein
MIPILDQDPPALPSDDDILALIRQEPGICLRQLAALLFPDLSWHAATLAPPPPESDSDAPSLALWLRERLRSLLDRGRIQVAPPRPGHADPLSGPGYLIPSA